MGFNAVPTVFQLNPSGQCTYPCFPGVLLTSTKHNTLSKPLAAFPHNHCQNNGQRWERNESCHNDYHQSSEGIFAEPGIEPATSCSRVCNASTYDVIYLISHVCVMAIPHLKQKLLCYILFFSKANYYSSHMHQRWEAKNDRNQVSDPLSADHESDTLTIQLPCQARHCVVNGYKLQSQYTWVCKIGDTACL